MTLFVDPPLFRLGRMRMCHLWSDAGTPEAARAELVAMLRQLGIDPRHVQEPPAASWLHADICRSKRAEAIRLGARAVDRYAAAEHCARIDAASRNPAIRRQGEIVLAQVARSRARRAGEGMPLFGESGEHVEPVRGGGR